MTTYDRLDSLLAVKLQAAQLARALDAVGLPGSADKATWIAAAVQSEIALEEKRLAEVTPPA